ncbi:hypothetical protein Vretimale_10263 [Volvox reticuliferus]|uniref:Amidase domain-containing protein n=1 Tax=Volvox reticuliferus TaxID=1737510 RepID=A0A8J4GF33_9CHLO|nr:hypothetical protein Vretimale_10263 [Volvox reticuliferus]
MAESEQTRGSDSMIAEVSKADDAPREAAAKLTATGDGTEAADDLQQDTKSEFSGQSDVAARQPLSSSSSPAIIAAFTSPQVTRNSRNRSSLLPIILTASALFGVWLVRRVRSRRTAVAAKAPSSCAAAAAADVVPAGNEVSAINAEPPVSPPEPIDPDMLAILVCGPSDAAATAARTVPPRATSSLPPLLAGVTFVVSEDVDLAGRPTTLGCHPHQSTRVVADACVGSFNQLPEAASSSCSAILRLEAAGAVCVGKAAMQPLGLDTFGANFGNPHNKAHISGGGQTGSAVAVSTDLAQLALTTDLLGSARVPAACCGVYCYRSTPGVLGHASKEAAATTATGVDGAGGGSSGGLLEGGESLAVMASDPGVLLKAAQALGVPGSFDLRGEIVRFVVAEDLFAICAVEYQPAVLAAKRAILKWAGSEQAGAVQLCDFLAENTPGWESLTPDELMADIGGLPRGLAAWATAARVLRAAHVNARLPLLPPPTTTATTKGGPVAGTQAELREKGAIVEAPESGLVGTEPSAEAAAGVVMGEEADPIGVAVEQAPADDADAGTASDGLAPRTAAGREGELDAEEAAGTGAGEDGQVEDDSGLAGSASREAEAVVVEGAAVEAVIPHKDSITPPVPPPERLAAAREAARQLYDTLRHTVKSDTVIVLPVVPTAPVKRRIVTEAAAAAAAGNGKVAPEAIGWEVLTHSFNCLAALAQCPVVVVPLGTVADDTPLAVALMGCVRFDARLVAVAAKMGPIMQEAFEGVKKGIAEAVRRQNEKQLSQEAAVAAAAAAPAVSAAAAAAAAAPAPPPPTPPSVDPRRLERAERFKARGNDLFRTGKFADALTEYSKAINEHPENPVYYNNRAMACLKIFRFEQAEEDCNRALKFVLKEADKAKALLRRATARTALQKYAEAEKDLRQVLSVEPNNRQAREDLQVWSIGVLPGLVCLRSAVRCLA